MALSLGASFTDLILVRPEATRFVGLDNWTRMLADPLVLKAIQVTASFMLYALPIAIGLPLLMAVLLNSAHLLVKPLFRALFFLPVLIPGVAASVIWQGVLNVHTGWLDLALRGIGLPGPDWLNQPQFVIPALSLISTWSVGNYMVIMLAGLQNVPSELYDAAKVDGANAFYRFFKITIPMISPVIFYNVTLGVIGAFQYFVPAMLIGGRNGDPQGATLFYPLHFYRQAFVFNDMGYGSVLALLLFVIVMIATGLLFFIGQRLVYYAGGEA
jgi:multiple sugar transport system permease protein